MKILLAMLTVFTFSAHALSDEQVRSEFNSTLEPFYREGRELNFVGKKNVRLVGRYFKHPAPSFGTIVIANGFGETFHKYVEVAYDLYQEGYSVFVYDHRGQGVSQHLLADAGRGYIDHYEYLVSDLKTFFETQVKPRASGPYFLLGHSLGGMTSARYVEEFPNDFVAVALSSPMLGIKFGWIGIDPAKWILDLASFFGYDQFYVQQPTNPLTVTFAKQNVTHDEIRYEILNQGIRALDPQAMIWGPTARWVDQSIHFGLTGLSEVAKAKSPILLLQAGKDQIVELGPEQEFCQKAPDCKLAAFAEAGHEILMETDTIRDTALDLILKHFASHRGSTVNENEILF